MRDEGVAVRARLSSLIFRPASFLSRYSPLIAWMAFIFLASTGSFSASNTSRIIRPLLQWLFPGINESQLLFAHTLTRKGAHLTEYAVLALLAARAFLNSQGERLRNRWYAAALALVVAVALLDEFHQSFEPTRTGTIYDSFIDMAGGTLAVAFVAWRRSRRARKGATA